jgi:hypothetical protein
MVESNYDILGVPDNASQKEIRIAFRKLALEHHSDRGGNDEKFKRIKLAFEDLKRGKKYPDSPEEIYKKNRFYSGDSEEEKRRKNLLLSKDVAQEMKIAEEWVAALNRVDATGVRLFGSKELGELEFERKANKALSIKGKYWAGHLRYDGPIIMWGSITNPYFSDKEEYKTHIRVTHGNFKLIDPIENKYDIENGAKITADDGDIIAGSVSGIKELLPDPQGRVGMHVLKEHFTQLKAPRGKIIAGNIRETVRLEAETIVVINLVDNIKIKGKNILVYGSKVNYNVEFELMKGGKIRFYDEGSGFDISDDAIVRLENRKQIRLRELKGAQMIGYGGKEITYNYLDGKEKNLTKKNGLGFRLGDFFK